MHQQPVADQPAVDENENGIAVVLLYLGTGNEAAQGIHRKLLRPVCHVQLLRVSAQLNQVFQRLAAKHLENAFPARLHRRGV